jgi:hypothetical protein
MKFKNFYLPLILLFKANSWKFERPADSGDNDAV